VLAALDDRRTVRWQTITVAVRDVAYASDGETMAVVCGDGGIWLYATRTDTWAYALDHDTDVFTGAFSPDGERFASVDKRGRVVIRDVRSTLTEAQRRDTSRKTYETGASRHETRSGY
jgi:WD40 repeat protein